MRRLFKRNVYVRPENGGLWGVYEQNAISAFAMDLSRHGIRVAANNLWLTLMTKGGR